MYDTRASAGSSRSFRCKLYRPPSEADALIRQATIGCSWNHCTYCDRDKPAFRVRPLAESLDDLEGAARQAAPHVEKVFVGRAGDGALGELVSFPDVREADDRLRGVAMKRQSARAIRYRPFEHRAKPTVGLEVFR